MSLRRNAAIWILGLFCHCAAGADLTPEGVVALAKIYFRDSAEVPMRVSVNTVVADKSGKVKERHQSAVTMIFHGYNLQTGHFSLRSNSGWFNTGALRDSLGGDLAAFISAAYLMPSKEGDRKVEISPDKPLVTVHDANCPALELSPRWLFPKVTCGTAQFSLAPAGDGWEFRQFEFASSGRSAPAKIKYLGAVQLTAFHATVDFQANFLPGAPKPFLWPKTVVTTLITDKGNISVTNHYSAKH